MTTTGMSGFSIDLRFKGGLTPPQQGVFATAAERWSRIITAGLPPVRVGGETIDNVVIYAQGMKIDGPKGILGKAGPMQLRHGSFIPAVGAMEFDTADLARMEWDGTLADVVIHEMAHVLGFGTIWDHLGQLTGRWSANPRYCGAAAMAECGRILGSQHPQPVPVANTGGLGTRGSHWRESVFGNELMTGFINLDLNPLSRLTIASFQDLGYQVDLAAADAFSLPSMQAMAVMGIGAIEHTEGCTMAGGFDRQVLPPEAFV